MPLDPVIAQGFRGIELQNPLDAYTRVNQLQQAQQQNQLNALKMQDYQREVESENRLRALYARPGVNTQSPEFLQEVYAVSPTKGAAMQKSALEVQKSQRESDKAAADIAATRMKMARDLLPSVKSPEAYANWRSYTLQNLPGLSNVIPEQYSPETTRNLMLEADKALEQHFVTQNMGGGQQVVGMPKYGGGAAAVVPGSYAADVPLPPDVAAQKVATALAGRPQVTVKLPEQEKEERGARGKLLVKQYEGVSETARLAGRTLPALETQERVLDSGFKTGFGTEAQKAGASVLAALGVPEAGKFATDAQTFLAATQQAVLQRQLEQKGVQTEADAARITQTGAQLGNTSDANKFIVTVAKTQLKRDIEQRNFYDKWWKENKTYDGAEDAWLTGQGGKSLFEAPELKKYAAPAKSTATPSRGRSSVQDQADAILRGGR
jgi:hypothetical protein